MRLEDQRWEHDEGEITCDGAVIARVLTPDDFPCLDPDENDIEAICKEIHATGELIAQAPAMLAMLRSLEWGGSMGGPDGQAAECCPRCSGIRPDGEDAHLFSKSYHGHRPDCDLALVLGKFGRGGS